MDLRACLHGGGVPQADEVTHLGGVTRLSIMSLAAYAKINLGGGPQVSEVRRLGEVTRLFV